MQPEEKAGPWCTRCGNLLGVFERRGAVCNACLDKPGCGEPAHVAGTSGGKLPCGSVLRNLDGTKRIRLCARCAASDAEWLHGRPLPAGGA